MPLAKQTVMTNFYFLMCIVLVLVNASCARNMTGADKMRPELPGEISTIGENSANIFNTQQMSGGNGEGYSGPSFRFSLIPEGVDSAVLSNRYNESSDVCLFGDSNQGLVGASERLLGVIYGDQITDEDLEKYTSKTLFSEDARNVYFVRPFLPIEWNSQLTGFQVSKTNGQDILNVNDGFEKQLSIRYFSYFTNQLETLQLEGSLPFFVNFGAYQVNFDQNFLKNNAAKKYGQIYFLKPSGYKTSFFYDKKGKKTQFFLNFQDLTECMQGESQKILEEENLKQDLASNVHRKSFLTWLLKNFQNKVLRSEGLNLTIGANKDITIEQFALKNQCGHQFKGRLVDFYRPIAVGKDQKASPVLQEKYRIEFKLTHILKDGAFQEIEIQEKNGILSIECESALSFPLTHGTKAINVVKREDGSLEKSLITFEWPVVSVSLSQMQVESLHGVQRFRVVHDGRQSNLPSMEISTARGTNKDKCQILNPWLNKQWQENGPTLKTVQERAEFLLSEYQVRRKVSADVFDYYFKHEKLEPSLFEECLEGLAERQNYLHTLSTVFHEKTLKVLQDIVSANPNQLPFLTEFLAYYQRTVDDGLPVLFRLAGHSGNQSGLNLPGGVLRGAPGMFVNVFKLQPHEYLLVWVHEMVHILDTQLQKATDDYSSAQSDILRFLKSGIDKKALDPKLINKLLDAGLERGILGEHRAWLTTFRVYKELLKLGFKKVPWLDDKNIINVEESKMSAAVFLTLLKINESHHPSSKIYNIPQVKTAYIEKLKELKVKYGSQVSR